MSKRWTMEQEAVLRKLRADGLSFDQISERTGWTRHKIHGKLDRLGLITKKEKAPKKEKPRPRKPPQSNFNPFKNLGKKSIAPPLSPAQKECILGQGITLLDLKPHHCRWPINSPERWGTYLFCGEKIEMNCYCGYHARIAYRRAA